MLKIIRQPGESHAESMILRLVISIFKIVFGIEVDGDESLKLVNKIDCIKVLLVKLILTTLNEFSLNKMELNVLTLETFKLEFMTLKA